MRTIDGIKYYRPREVVQKQLISLPDESTEDSNYHFVLRLIRKGRLAAIDQGTNPKNPYYLVSDEALAAYRRSTEVRS